MKPSPISSLALKNKCPCQMTLISAYKINPVYFLWCWGQPATTCRKMGPTLAHVPEPSWQWCGTSYTNYFDGMMLQSSEECKIFNIGITHWYFLSNVILWSGSFYHHQAVITLVWLCVFDSVWVTMVTSHPCRTILCLLSSNP